MIRMHFRSFGILINICLWCSYHETRQPLASLCFQSNTCTLEIILTRLTSKNGVGCKNYRKNSHQKIFLGGIYGSDKDLEDLVLFIYQ